jgi:hypothetical protein
MDLYGTITDSHQIAFAKDTNEQRRRFLASCKPGTVVKETLLRHRPEKTHQQVKLIWGLLIEHVKKGLDAMGFDLATLFPTAQVPPGVPCPREVLMQLFYACCNDVGENGERKTLSQMNTVEAAAFFEACRDHAARTWGIIVPEPDPNWKQVDAKEEVGVTDLKEEEPAPVSDPGKPYVCRKCGVLYRVNPARGVCVAEDSDGFRCKGPVVKREEA